MLLTFCIGANPERVYIDTILITWGNCRILCHLRSYIPERAGYVDMHLSLLCDFLPSVALRTTHRHTVLFLRCLKCILKWIHGYSDTQ